MSKDKDSFQIPLAVSDAIINYLSERPYKETTHLIQALQQAYTESNKLPVEDKAGK